MQYKKIAGFTIFELSIVIILFGVLILIAMGLFSRYYRAVKEHKTKISLETIEASLFEFQARMGRYPCPADSTLLSSNPQYGIEKCVGGVTTTGRDANGDSIPDNILIGSIPYKTMIDPDGDVSTEDGVTSISLTDIHTKDGWNNRLTYAVSENLTNLITFSEDFGAISIVDEYNQSVVIPEGSAHLVLISHGENGRGAYSTEGELISTCGTVLPSPPALFKDDRENCNNDDIFISGLKNDHVDYTYDDKVKFLNVKTSVFWVYTGPNQVMNSNPGFVGVGVENPEERFHVDGDLASTFIYANSICDGAGENCMPIETIGGDVPSMTCGGDQVAVGIEKNRILCEDLIVNSTLNSCPSGEVMVGISNKGSVKCSVP